MSVFPVEIQRQGSNELLIRWSDGASRLYSPRELRDCCPCATCRERNTAGTTTAETLLPILAPAEARPLTVVGMKPVGNYAYAIHFSDDHDSGIYVFPLLRELGRDVV